MVTLATSQVAEELRHKNSRAQVITESDSWIVIGCFLETHISHCQKHIPTSQVEVDDVEVSSQFISVKRFLGCDQDTDGVGFAVR